MRAIVSVQRVTGSARAVYPWGDGRAVREPPLEAMNIEVAIPEPSRERRARTCARRGMAAAALPWALGLSSLWASAVPARADFDPVGFHHLSWGSAAGPPQSPNLPPNAPTITEPAVDGQVVNPSDVHMETAPFVDPDPGDQHDCTDWEIWTGAPPARVWTTLCIGGPEALHTHLADGVFEGSHAARTELLPNQPYQLRVRHKDSSGEAATEWSPWSTRAFVTGSASTVFPLELADVRALPVPRWTAAAGGAPIDLDGGGMPPSLRLESAGGALLLSIAGAQGPDAVVNPPALGHHAAARLVLDAGAAPWDLSATDLVLVDEACRAHRILLPALQILPGAPRHLWVARTGATYHGAPAQSEADFSSPARVPATGWFPRQPGFEVDVFAEGLRLPVHLAFLPGAGPGPDEPFFYVAELYGAIRAVTRDGTVSDYATGLLNYDPSGAFPGSGEQGLTGLAVDPDTGDVYAGMLYLSAGGALYPRIDRFRSFDGGRTAGVRETVLDMPGEAQAQSHQISQLTFLPDGTLLCHMGDGFVVGTAQDLESFRGKILRLTQGGLPASDNPFFDPADGLTARDYVWAYGLRNPFGGAWRAADGLVYQVENGPAVDRLAQVVPGRNFGWNGSDASMQLHALYNWSPAHAPVNLAFVQPETFGGSAFPPEKMGHAFVSESGPTYATGPQARGKRVVEFVLGRQGQVLQGPVPFLEYAGSGRATACGLAAGPDGLYLTDLYRDDGHSPTSPGARVLRVRRDPAHDCNGNGVDDLCDIAAGTSLDLNGDHVPDECQCAGTAFCPAAPNSTGMPAELTLGGSCATAENTFVLSAAPVPQAPGIFFYGGEPVGGGAGTPFMNGLLCVTGSTFRLSVVLPDGAAALLAVDLENPPSPAGGFLPGSTWHFQYWFRDAAGGGSQANLSSGLSVTFE